MARVDTTSLVSISEVSAKGLSAYIRAAEQGHDTVFLKSNRPVAALVSMDRLDRMDELEDLALALARVMTDDDQRTDLDSVLSQLGFTREELRNDPAYSE